VKTLDERLNGLRWRLRAMRRLWSSGAEPHMPFIPPEPFDAVPRGRIESPAAGLTIASDTLHVAGWAFFPGAPTSRIDVWLGEKPLGRARMGVARPDLAELTDLPWAGVSGFELTVDLTDQPDLDGRASLRASAASTGGERLDLDPVEIALGDADTDEGDGELPVPPKPTPAPANGDGPHVLIYTHQLNLGGAQLYLMDLIRGLLKRGAIRLTVVSAIDGRLRGELEELGIPVHIGGSSPMDHLSPHMGRLEQLVAWSADRDFDLILVNTATGLALPGAELANELGIPAIWSIHESFPLSILWGDPPLGLLKQAKGALEKADTVLFEAEATREMFAPYVSSDRARVIPYGLDFGAVEAAQAGFDRDAARRRASIPDDAEVVLCVGTVEPRKAQLPLAQAFELVAARQPNARLVFVGGDDKQYSRMLADYIAGSKVRERIELLPVTPDIQTWYGIAALFVCASDVESLPRTVLEAMLWETPVLATDVYGLPELISDGENGWLCEPRDTGSLADALDRALSTAPGERQGLAARARRMVEERHSLPAYADEVARLLDEALTKRG